MVTTDICQLYTHVPNDISILAAKNMLNKYRPESNVCLSNNFLIKLLELVLNKNNFQFSGENVLPVSGISMGTKCAPMVANTMMDFFKEAFVYQYLRANSLNHLFYGRYLDDCLMVWQYPKQELIKFLAYINQYLPSIKFTWDISPDKVNVLDTVKIVNNKIEFELYCKPTDAHNFLRYDPAHPRACKQAYPI